MTLQPVTSQVSRPNSPLKPISYYKHREEWKKCFFLPDSFISLTRSATPSRKTPTTKPMNNPAYEQTAKQDSVSFKSNSKWHFFKATFPQLS
jgi:hypothetical protein